MWLTAAVTVSVLITHPASRVVGSGNCQCSGSVASSSELFTVVRPSIWDKSRDFEIGQWGRPWLVWYVPCKRRYVPRFTKLKHRHRHRNYRRWRCETHSVGTRWQSVGDPHDAIFTVSDELSMTVKCVTTIACIVPQIYQSIFQINRPERKTVYSKPCHVLRGEKCTDASRMFALKYRVRRDLNTDVSVFDWHAWLGLASRWRLAVAKGQRENCRDVGRAPTRKVHTVICHRSGHHYLKSGGPTYI